MSNKQLFAIIIFAFVGIVFTTAAYAGGWNLFCPDRQHIIVTLKNDADIEKSKEAILNIPQIKIVDIKYRDKEWSKKVNKYDLPNMENPFKNQIIIKANKNADMTEIYSNLKAMTFVEKIEYSSDKLALLGNYQEQYFKIVKRNNILLNFEDDKALNNDRKELKKLYKEVEKQIKNKEYLAEYEKIEKKYLKCDEITTVGMNEFSIRHNEEIDALLNTVFKKVQSTIPPEDFKNLILSEQKWLKETEEYKKVYDAMEFGTIGTVIYYDYQTNMKSFRALLLMMYL